MDEKRIVNYTVATERTPVLLANTVKGLIAHGWMPLGGVSITSEPDRYTLAQALVKYLE
ncbi:DUF1737 domain-containing protein [Hymenobacter metallicola]